MDTLLLMLVALFAVSGWTGAEDIWSGVEPEPGELREAQTFAQASGLPQADVRRMQQLIAQVDNAQHGWGPIGTTDLRQIASFLAQWVNASRHLAPGQKAAGLYTADLVLGDVYIPANIDRQTGSEIDEAIPRIKSELIAAGAHFAYDELGASYRYGHDWVEEAFRAAPHSAAGKHAFLFILDHAFDPGGCGEGFEEVIKRAPSYLREYSEAGVRAHILLAIGDAYRDRIAVANGANGDPWDEAARYKPQVQQNYREALRYYREATKTSPGSAPAQQAKSRASALLAGKVPLDTRFVCIYD